MVMSHLREEGDRLYRHIRLDWYVLVTKTGKGGLWLRSHTPMVMSHLREEGDRLYRHIRLDWYVLVTKTGKGGHRTGEGCLQNRYSDRYWDRQSDIKLLNTCVHCLHCLLVML